MLVGECPDTAGAVDDSCAPALVGSSLAGEQQEPGRAGHCRSVGMRDQLGVGKACIAGTVILRLCNYGYAVRAGIPVRSD